MTSFFSACRNWRNRSEARVLLLFKASGCSEDGSVICQSAIMTMVGMVTRCCSLSLLVILCCSVLVGSNNWGKKVSCFVFEETLMCPGCNSRAGRTCPRTSKGSQNCLVSSTTPSPKPSSTPETTYEEDDNTTEAMKILRSNFTTPNRYKREVLQQEQKEEGGLEICNWSGDCPCPLICCKTGPGCPKRCVRGITLPPPWG